MANSIKIRMPDGSIEFLELGKNAGRAQTISHSIWALDYKTYGESSYVYQNKEFFKELLSDVEISMQDDALREIVVGSAEENIGNLVASITGDTSFESYSTWNSILADNEAVTKMVSNPKTVQVITKSPTLYSKFLGNATARGAMLDSNAAMEAIITDADKLNSIFAYPADIGSHAVASNAFANSELAIDTMLAHSNINTITSNLFSQEAGREAFVASTLAMNKLLEKKGAPLTYLFNQGSALIANNENWMAKLVSTAEYITLVTQNSPMSNAIYDSDMAVQKLVGNATAMHTIGNLTSTNYLAQHLVSKYDEQRVRSFETVVNSTYATNYWFNTTSGNAYTSSYSPSYYLATKGEIAANILGDCSEAVLRRIMGFVGVYNRIIQYPTSTWKFLCAKPDKLRILGTMQGLVAATWNNQSAMANLASQGKDSVVAYLSQTNSFTWLNRKNNSYKYAAIYYNTGLAGLLQYPANFLVDENIDVIAVAFYNANGASAFSATNLKSYLLALNGEALLDAIVDVNGTTGFTNFMSIANAVSIIAENAGMLHKVLVDNTMRSAINTVAAHNTLTSIYSTLVNTMENAPDKFSKTALSVSSNSNVGNYYLNEVGNLVNGSGSTITYGASIPVIVVAALGVISTSYTGYFGSNGVSTQIYTSNTATTSSPTKVLVGGMWAYGSYSSYRGRYLYMNGTIYKAI